MIDFVTLPTYKIQYYKNEGMGRYEWCISWKFTCKAFAQNEVGEKKAKIKILYSEIELWM